MSSLSTGSATASSGMFQRARLHEVAARRIAQPQAPRRALQHVGKPLDHVLPQLVLPAARR